MAGASGFVGRNIVAALAGRVERLIGVNRSGAPVAGCHATSAADRLADLPALPARTVLINVAAHRYRPASFAADQPAIWSSTVGITDTLYRFAIARGIREMRVASSSAVYPADWALQDDAIPLDLNAWPHDGEAAYAWSKRWGEITAELWHRRAGIATISFRLTNPYGPHDTLDEDEAHVATAFAIRALTGQGDFAIRGNADAERDFVHAADVAETFVRSLALREVQAAVNLACGATTRIADLARAAMRAAGRERALRTQASGGAGVAVRRATAERLRALLPDLPEFRGLEAGMASTIAWYRDVLR